MCTTTIFNIQKFSIHDGPGIRTTVFFKGCPLSCKWCANPESQATRIQILWDQKLCIGCQSCLLNCPNQAITASENGIHINESKCRLCMTCVNGCPRHALSQEGEPKTVDEVMDVVLQDVDFYEESGGGVTLSGGEVLLHSDFASALLKKLKEKGIHTALETTGFSNRAIFSKTIEYADLLLFDMKHWNEDKHKEGTGVSNKIILENMAYAIASGKDVLPRLPIIPGFNNSPEDAAQFAETLKSLGATRAQLLPFHQFGENKYHSLGKVYEYENVPVLHPEDLEDFRQVFEDHGIHAFF